jgi:hypothetical protein
VGAPPRHFLRIRSPKELSVSEINIPFFEVTTLRDRQKRAQEQLRVSKRCIRGTEAFPCPLLRWSNDVFQKLAIVAAIATAISASAFPQQSTTTGVATSHADILSSIPSTATTVTNYYKQTLYDPSDTKIGEIVDVLVGNDGKIADRLSRWLPRNGLEGRCSAVQRRPCDAEERKLVSDDECHERRP